MIVLQATWAELEGDPTPSPPQSKTRAQPTGVLDATVAVRWTPLVPAPSGTWVARSASTTMARIWRDGSQLACWVRLVLGDHLPRWQTAPAGLWVASDRPFSP